MNEQTPKLGFPLLASGQAQKEVTHNEALVLADALVLQAYANAGADVLYAPGLRTPEQIRTVVQAVAPAAIPASPVPGQCWIVGAGAGGVWAGHDNAIACWTGGGWRFVASREGMWAWSLADSLPARREANGWTLGQLAASALRIGGDQVVGARRPAIAGAADGSTVDAEARVTVSAILEALRAHGLIAP